MILTYNFLKLRTIEAQFHGIIYLYWLGVSYTSFARFMLFAWKNFEIAYPERDIILIRIQIYISQKVTSPQPAGQPVQGNNFLKCSNIWFIHRSDSTRTHMLRVHFGERWKLIEWSFTVCRLTICICNFLHVGEKSLLGIFITIAIL